MDKEDATHLAFSLPDLDRAIEVPKNSEKIKKSLEKITANTEIWFNRPLFRDHYKNPRLADLSLEKIHVFGKRGIHSRNQNISSMNSEIDFGYVIEIVSKNRGGLFYVNLTQKYVDEYILPGEIKITKGGVRNRNFVRPTAI